MNARSGLKAHGSVVAGWIVAKLFLLCTAVVAGAAVEPPAGLQSTPPRLGYLEGEVLFWRPGDGDWEGAELNTPLAPGDALATRAGKIELQVGGKSFIRVGDGSQIRLQSNEPDFLLLEVIAGHLAADLRDLRRGAVQIDTPNAVISIAREGYYRVDVEGDRTRVVVRRGGYASITPANHGAIAVATGEAVDIIGTNSHVEQLAAPPFDDWDRWNYARADTYLSAPRSYAVSEEVYGTDELERHGTWRHTESYGRVWVPTEVSAGWAPYTNGRWRWDPLYGWAWVDFAPWGWAPFHYGRWVHTAGFWGWAPGPIIAAPFWSPALVGFFGGPGFSVGISVPFVSWVALGWGEPLVPWWGGVGFIGSPCWWGWGGPRVVNNVVINNFNTVTADTINVYRNQNVPGALVGVPKDQFDTNTLHEARLTNISHDKVQPLRGALPIEGKGVSAGASGLGGRKDGPNLTGLRADGTRNAPTGADFSRGGNPATGSAGNFSRGGRPDAALKAGAGAGGGKPESDAFDALRQRGAGQAGSGAVPNLAKPGAASSGSANMRRGQSPPSLSGGTKAGGSAFDALRQRGVLGSGAGGAPNINKPSAPQRGSSNLRRGQAPPPVTGKAGESAFDALRQRGAGGSSAPTRQNLVRPSAPRAANLNRGAAPPSLSGKQGSAAFDSVRRRGTVASSRTYSSRGANLSRGQAPSVSRPRGSKPGSIGSIPRQRGTVQRAPQVRRGAPAAPSRRPGSPGTTSAKRSAPSLRSYRAPSQPQVAAPSRAPSGGSVSGFSRGGGGAVRAPSGGFSRGGGAANFGRSMGGGGGGWGGGGGGGRMGGAMGSGKLGR